MDWKKQFRIDENELKTLIDKLAQAPAGDALAWRYGTLVWAVDQLPNNSSITAFAGAASLRGQ